MEDKDFAELITDICLEDEEFWKMTRKHHFSADYRRRKRKKLRELRRQKKEQGYGFLPLYPVRRRRAFVILVLLMILLMGVAITAKELKLKYFHNLEIQGLEDHVQFDTTAGSEDELCLDADVGGKGNQVLTEEMLVYPRYVPEGYESCVEAKQILHNVFRESYIDNLENSICYVQTCNPDNIGISTDGQEMTDAMVNDREGVFISDNGYNNLLWSDGTSYYLLTGVVSREELLRMAESVE